MTINVERDFGKVLLEITGILDSTTSPNLDKTISELAKDTTELSLNIAGLDYISSAGINVLLKAYKNFSKTGVVTISGANDTVREAFSITGFSDILSY